MKKNTTKVEIAGREMEVGLNANTLSSIQLVKSAGLESDRPEFCRQPLLHIVRPWEGYFKCQAHMTSSVK